MSTFFVFVVYKSVVSAIQKNNYVWCFSLCQWMQKPITRSLDLRYCGWFLRFSGWQLNNSAARQRYNILFFQTIQHFIQIVPEGLMHLIGFASIDFSYTTMPISNFLSQKCPPRRSCYLYTEFSRVSLQWPFQLIESREQIYFNRAGNKAWFFRHLLPFLLYQSLNCHNYFSKLYWDKLM